VSRAGWRRTETSVQEEARDKGSISAAAEAFSFSIADPSFAGAFAFRRVQDLVDGYAAAWAWTARGIGFEFGMHVGYYLMIAALVLMGLEVLYALYQLATFL
jgi:hypothetical protein